MESRESAESDFTGASMYSYCAGGSGPEYRQVRSGGSGSSRRVLYITDFHAGSIWIYSDSNREGARVYRPGDSSTGHDFWSESVSGDTVLLEYQPEAGKGRLQFSVAEIAHQFRSLDD